MSSRSPVIPTGDEEFALESFVGVEGPCVAEGTTQMCGVLVFAARSTSTTLKITHFPSGDGWGSATRFSFIMSSKVNGCLAWVNAGTADTKRRIERRRWRMKVPPTN